MGSAAETPTDSIIITIDGPSGTGKSAVAHGLARRLGLVLLDTGSMYRAAALLATERGIAPDDGPALADALRHADMRFDWSADPPRLMLGDRDVSERIRDLDVSAIVSVVAAQPAVRAVLVEAQRRIAREHPRLVSEGRDQGSVVFPDASVRFYLDASGEVRAQRRLAQLRAAGKRVDREQVALDLQERDHRDSSRTLAPLLRPEGAVELDTTSMTLEEVVAELERIVRRKVPSLGHAS